MNEGLKHLIKIMSPAAIESTHVRFLPPESYARQLRSLCSDITEGSKSYRTYLANLKHYPDQDYWLITTSLVDDNIHDFFALFSVGISKDNQLSIGHKAIIDPMDYNNTVPRPDLREVDDSAQTQTFNFTKDPSPIHINLIRLEETIDNLQSELVKLSTTPNRLVFNATSDQHLDVARFAYTCGMFPESMDGAHFSLSYDKKHAIKICNQALIRRTSDNPLSNILGIVKSFRSPKIDDNSTISPSLKFVYNKSNSIWELIFTPKSVKAISP